jgi:hypothetical protein
LPNPEYLPLSGFGDPTAHGARAKFSHTGAILPVGCSNATLYAFQGPGNPNNATVTLVRNVDGAPVSTGLTLTTSPNRSANADGAISIKAGEVLAYQVSVDGLSTDGLILSIGLTCH